MSHIGTEDKFLQTLFPENIEDLRVLDVGHGYGATALYFRSRTFKRGWAYIIGVDPNREYHEMQNRMAIYDELYVAKGEALPFKDKYFGFSIAQQVIEHTSKVNGIMMLSEMERVTKGRVVICTPNGFAESTGARDGSGYNDHLSGWSVEDFTTLGYEARIVTKQINSRLLVAFAKLVFWLRRKHWDNEMIVAWRDV